MNTCCRFLLSSQPKSLKMYRICWFSLLNFRSKTACFSSHYFPCLSACLVKESDDDKESDNELLKSAINLIHTSMIDAVKDEKNLRAKKELWKKREHLQVHSQSPKQAWSFSITLPPCVLDVVLCCWREPQTYDKGGDVWYAALILCLLSFPHSLSELQSRL